MVVPTCTAVQQPSDVHVFRTDAVTVTYSSCVRDFVHARSPPSLDLPLCTIAPKTLQPESITVSSVFGELDTLVMRLFRSYLPLVMETGVRDGAVTSLLLPSACCAIPDVFALYRTVPTRRRRGEIGAVWAPS